MLENFSKHHSDTCRRSLALGGTYIEICILTPFRVADEVKEIIDENKSKQNNGTWWYRSKKFKTVR